MMKQIFYPIAFLFFTINVNVFGQCPPPGEPSPGIDACSLAPIYCNGLDGFCNTLGTADTPGAFPGCTANALNNDEWLAFIAGSTQITLEVTPSNCVGNAVGTGVQAAIYDGCGGAALATQCNCTTGVFNLSSSSYVIGETYYMAIDGCAGDVCDYSLAVTSGSMISGVPDTPGPISGPTAVCPGANANYSIEPPVGASIYNWVISPPSLGSINGDPNSSTINITWNTLGAGTLCVDVANECSANPVPSCITIFSNPIPPTPELHDVCLGDCVECAGQLICTPGVSFVTLQSWLGCDSVIQCVINPIFIDPTNFGQVTLCAPDTYDVCGTVYDESQVITQNCTSYQGCDSLIIVDLAILDPQVIIIQPDDIECGANAIITIDGSNSTISNAPNVVTTYFWTGAGIVGPNDGPTVDVNVAGTYCLNVTQERDGAMCSSEECVDVMENIQTPEPPTIFGNEIVCEGDMEIYTASDFGAVMATGFTWTTPNGEPITIIDMSTVEITWTTAGSSQICATADNDCGSSMETCLTITIGADPLDPMVTGPATTCEGQTETFAVTNADPDCMYSWIVPTGASIIGSGSTISVDFSGAMSGDVCVTCVNSCGTSQDVCTSIVVENVPLAPVFDSGDVDVCDGEMVMYCMIEDPTATDYTWIGPNGNLPGNGFCNTIDWTGGNSGQVCVTANNDCGSSPQTCFDITINEAPTAIISGMGAFCTGSGDMVDLDIVLTGTAPWNVTYTIDGMNPTQITINSSPFVLSAGTAGTYELTVVDDASGCPGTFSGSGVVTENPLPTAVVSGGGAICAGSGATVDVMITLTGTPNWTINWTLNGMPQAALNNITTSPFVLSLTETQAGEVLVTDVTDGNNCTNVGDGSSATVVVNEAPTVSAIATTCNNTNTQYTVEFTISGGDAASYTVNGSTMGIGSGNPIVFTSDPITSGDGYNFVVTDGNNCNPITVQDAAVECNCETQAGEMNLTPIEACDDEPITASYNLGMQNLDGDDAVNFLLHSGSGASIDPPIFQVNALPTFSFDMNAGMEYGVTYYISAVVGNDIDMTGIVDLNDSCTDAAQGTPVTWYLSPTAVLSGDPSICDGEMASLTINFTGIAPWTIDYDDGSGNLTEITGISSNPFTLNVSPNTSTIYTLETVIDDKCEGDPSGTSTVTVNTPVQINNEGFTCNNTGTGYTVSFEISGGDPSSYTVNGSTDGIVIGNSTIFTSDEMMEGTGFNFVIDDANSCGPITYTDPLVECNCLTTVGTMDAMMIASCGDGLIMGTYDNTGENLDADDIIQYVLQTGNGTNLQTIITGPINTPEFSFDAGNMTYGTTYYISALAGSDDGTGNIDLTDPCLDVAAGTPIVFYEIPTATLSGDTSVCAGEMINLEIAFTGDSPYEIIISGGAMNDTITGINSNPFIYTTTTSVSTIYSLLSVNDENCPGTVGGTAMVSINEAPTVSNILVNCNATGTAFTVSFEILGGDDNCYEVTGDAGNLAGNVFTSNEIPSGEDYTFFVDDCNDCGPLIVQDTMIICDCVTQVGEMEISQTLSACGDDPVNATYTGIGEMLDGDDIVAFIIHTGDNTSIATNSTPEFSASSIGFDYGTTYFISAVAGSDNGVGNIDFNDPCLSISVGVPVVFYEIPNATLSGTDTICSGNIAQLMIDFSGPGPWDITYTDNNGNPTTETGIMDNPYILEVSPTATDIITLTEVSNANCPGMAGGVGFITVAAPPSIINVFTTPDAANLNYVVTFNITGGDANSYVVNGDPGTLNGDLFTSDPIPCGGGYSFSVDDGNGCGPVLVEDPNVICNCVSEAGEMDPVQIDVCEGELAEATYNDFTQFLDGNDAVMFVLHTGAMNILGTIIQTNSTPSFGFDGGSMTTGTTYYISAVVGDDDGTGIVDLNDPCLSIAVGTPVVFHEIPTVSTIQDQTLCEGDDIIVQFFVTGEGPWDVTFEDPIFGQQTINVQFDGQGFPINNAPAGIFTYSLVSVTNAFCTNTSTESVTITVNAPANPGDFTEPARTCQGSNDVIDLSSLLENADDGGDWENMGGNAISEMFNTTGLPAGTYQFTYTVQSLAPCPAESEEVEVIIDELPVADAGENRTIDCDILEVCIGGQNTSVGDFTYQWSGGPNNMDRIQCGVTEPGVYTLTVTNNQTGCTATDEVTVGQDLEQPIPTVSVGGTTCFGDSDGFISVDTIVGGEAPYLCSFNGGPFSSQTQFTGLSAGVYEVVCMDAKGCDVLIEVSVEQPAELDVNLNGNFNNEDNLVTLGDSLQIQVQVTLPFDSLDAIFWQPADAVACDTCELFYIHPQEELSLTVTVTENGCTDSDNLQIFVETPRDIHAPNIFSPNDDGTNDVFQIFGGSGIAEVESFIVFNRWGEVVWQDFSFQPGDPASGWDGTHRGEKLNPAVYTWFAKVRFLDGETEMFKGDVSLVK